MAVRPRSIGCFHDSVFFASSGGPAMTAPMRFLWPVRLFGPCSLGAFLELRNSCGVRLLRNGLIQLVTSGQPVPGELGSWGVEELGSWGVEELGSQCVWFSERRDSNAGGLRGG